MKLTKERKIYGGILVIAVLALTIDWLSGGFSSGRAAADADPASLLISPGPVSHPPAGPVHSAAKGLDSIDPTANGVAVRLRLAAPKGPEIAQLRDAFHPGGDWLSGSESTDVSSSATEEEAIARFSQAHRVTAVLQVGKVAPNHLAAGYAVLDGKYVSVGESVDRFRLIGIDRGQAIFAAPSGKQRVRLSVTPDAASAPRDAAE